MQVTIVTVLDENEDTLVAAVDGWLSLDQKLAYAKPLAESGKTVHFCCTTVGAQLYATDSNGLVMDTDPTTLLD